MGFASMGSKTFIPRACHCVGCVWGCLLPRWSTLELCPISVTPTAVPILGPVDMSPHVAEGFCRWNQVEDPEMGVIVDSREAQCRHSVLISGELSLLEAEEK